VPGAIPNISTMNLDANKASVHCLLVFGGGGDAYLKTFQMEVDLKLSLKHCFRVPRIVGNDNINGFIILNSEQNTFFKKILN
jgi:hypothetical protein